MRRLHDPHAFQLHRLAECAKQGEAAAQQHGRDVQLKFVQQARLCGLCPVRHAHVAFSGGGPGLGQRTLDAARDEDERGTAALHGGQRRVGQDEVWHPVRRVEAVWRGPEGRVAQNHRAHAAQQFGLDGFGGTRFGEIPVVQAAVLTVWPGDEPVERHGEVEVDAGHQLFPVLERS